MGATRTVRIVYETNARPSLGEADKSTQELASSSAKAQAEITKLNAQFARTSGSLDPHIAAHNRYSQSIGVLNQALSKGVVTQEEHARLLDLAKTKYEESGQKVSQFSQLMGRLTELTSIAGPAAEEAAEKLGLISGKVAGITELVASLGPLAPVLLGAAAAVAVIGVAWKGFELTADFLKDAIKEGADFEQTIAKLNNTLKANGSASGLSAHEILEFGESMSIASARPTAEIVKGLAVLTQFQKIGHETFERASRDILDYAQQTGTAPEEAFQKFGRALEGGQRGLRALEEVGGVFLQSQKATLRQMLDNGDVIGYQTLLLKILEEHVKGAAEAYGKTLNGQVAQSKNVLIDLKEGIASEVIPALEDLVNTVVGSLGGWKQFRETAKAIGHDVGDSIRTMVYDVQIYYHQYEESSWLLTANVTSAFGNLVTGTLKLVGDLSSGLAKVPVFGAPYKEAAEQIKSAQADIGKYFEEHTRAALQSAQGEAQAILLATTQLNNHRQALEGDTTLQGLHGSSIDSVAKKVKDLAGIYEQVNKALESYDNKLSDQEHKLGLAKESTEALLSAAQKGLYEYALEKEAQDRLNAVTAQTITLDKEHRTEIDALTTAHEKLIKLGKTADAAAVTAIIERQNKLYVDQRAHVAGLVNDRATLAQAENTQLVIDNEEKTLLNQLAIAKAKILDVENNNTDATRKLNLELSGERDRLALLPPVIRLYLEGLRDTADQTTRLLDVTKGLSGLHLQAQFDVAVSSIDSTLTTGLQQIELKYLDFLRSIGKGSLDAGTRLLEEYATAHKTTLDKLTADIKDAIGQINDSKLVSKYTGGGQTIFDQYAQERAGIERLMSQSSDRVHLTVKDGLKALEDLQDKYINNQLSAYSSALGILSQEFGGVFTKIQRFVQILQEIQTLRQDVSTIVSGLGGLGTIFGSAATTTATNTSAVVGLTAAINANTVALGSASTSNATSSAVSGVGGGGYASGAAGGLAVVGAFVAAYLIGSQILNVRDRHGFGSPGSYQIVDGHEIESGETAIAESIKKFVDTIQALAGATITSLDSIGIKIQNSGKRFRAYVGDTLLGTFDSLSEALTAAVQRSLSTAKFSKNIDPAIAEFLATAQTRTATNIDDFTAALKTIRAAIDQNLPKIALDFRKLSSDFDSAFAAQLEIFGSRASAGLSELFGLDLEKWRGGVDSLRDSITGQQKSAFILFEQQRQAFNAENDARRLSILTQEAETKTKLLALGVTLEAINKITGAVVAAQSGLQAISAADQILGTLGPDGGDTNLGRRNYDLGRGPGGNNGGGSGNGVNVRVNNIPPNTSGFKDQSVEDLKALLAELVKQLGTLPDNIKASEFRNQNSPEYYANQFAAADADFRKLVSDLAAAGQSADEFGSSLKSDLGNYALTLLDQRNAITGATRSAKEELEIKIQQAKLLDAQVALERADIETRIIDLKARIDSANIQTIFTSVMVQSGKYIAQTAVDVAQVVGAAGQFTEAQLEAMRRQLEALQGLDDILKNYKPIDPNEIRLSGGKGGSTGQTPAQQLAAFFAAFDRAQLPALSQQIAGIDESYDNEIRLAHATGDALKHLNDNRQAEINKAKEQARQTQVGSAQSFIDSGLPDLVKQVNAVHDGSQKLIDGLRELNKQGGLSTEELHRLVPALREAEKSQVAAIKSGILAQIDQFSGALANQGLTGELKSIADQSKALRDSLNALAQAGTLTADEFFRSATKIIEAAHAQEQAKFDSSSSGLLGELYGYLHNDVGAAKLKYSLTLLDIQARYAQLRNEAAIYGLSGTYLDEIGSALGQFEKAGWQQFLSASQSAGQSQLDASQNQQQAAADNLAAAQKLTEWQQSLYTNPETSPVSARKQVEISRSQLDTLIAQAEGGDQTAKDKFTTEADTFLSLYRTAFGKTGEYARNVAELSGVADILKVQLTGNPGQNLAVGQFGQSPGAFPVDPSGYQGYVSPNAPAGLGRIIDRSSDSMPPTATEVVAVVAAVTDSQAKTLTSLTTISQNLSQTGDLYKVSQSIGIDASKFYISALDGYSKIIDTLSDILEEMRALNSSAQRKQAV